MWAERVPATAQARDVIGFTADTLLDEVVPWAVDAVDRDLI